MSAGASEEEPPPPPPQRYPAFAAFEDRAQLALRGLLDSVALQCDDLDGALADSRAREHELTKRDRALTVQQNDLARRETELRCSREELENEKETMRKDVTGNDLVSINMGGEKFVTVKRSLLWQFEGTMLERMFSGRHEDTMDRDSQGRVFFDYSPHVMMPLIDFLRLHRDRQPNDQKAPRLPDSPREKSQKEAWHLMLDFFGFGLLQFRTSIGFAGVRTEVPIDELTGWVLFFCEPYKHCTRMEDFVPTDNLRGRSLLVGARRAGSQTLEVAAMGNVDVLTAERDDDSVIEHNGAYWYCWREKAFGFAPDPDVWLNQWGLDASNVNGDKRLSWNLAPYCGGYRAGSNTNLYHTSTYEKVLFIGNAAIPEDA